MHRSIIDHTLDSISTIYPAPSSKNHQPLKTIFPSQGLGHFLVVSLVYHLGIWRPHIPNGVHQPGRPTQVPPLLIKSLHTSMASMSFWMVSRSTSLKYSNFLVVLTRQAKNDDISTCFFLCKRVKGGWSFHKWCKMRLGLNNFSILFFCPQDLRFDSRENP